jgi:predicted NAD/FAD-binding protein
VRIAIIGTGVSGLVAAHLLTRRHDVTLFEAAAYAGGHTHTVTVRHQGETLAIDTGFIVFNDRNYSNFTRLIERLGVAARPTTMSFSVSCERTGVEYNGTSINRLFAQRRNLARPSFLRMVRDILKFNRLGPAQAAALPGATVSEFLAAHARDYSAGFEHHYLVPIGASLWSCPPRTFRAFPMRFVIEFLANHGMLQVHGRPAWRVIRGGSAHYVEALTRPFRERIRLSTPVRSIRRSPEAVQVTTPSGVETFDEVVVATHSDQALGMLADADPEERDLLGAFPYQANEAVLHRDARLLPATRRAWAAWNYRVPAVEGADVLVTYNMNILQSLESRSTWCVSLNAADAIDPSLIIARVPYHHPVFTTRRDDAQRRHGEFTRRRRISFCGAYWGSGFHEDGVNSALAVARTYGEEL